MKKGLCFFCLLIFILFTACGSPDDSSSHSVYADEVSYIDPAADPSVVKGTRDNSIRCLVPKAPGTTVFSSSNALIDVSNTGEGYLCASYSGDCPKVKLQITGPDSVTYSYDMHGGPEYFPLSAGSGTYTIGVYENITSNQYSVNLVEEVEVAITNEFGAFLYPNQYCMFDSSSETVKKAADLAFYADTDLDVITNIYNYVIKTIAYDYDMAENIQSGYVCDVDAALARGRGICLDYAAVMTCMLRSQGIPARLEVGYAGSAYHAWISAYVEEKGWINGIIEFDGTSWSLMDPTFSANTEREELKRFIGDGSNYLLKFVY